MAGRISYRFCRYQMMVGEELLGAAGQTQQITEVQGDFYEYGTSREGNPLPRAIVMEPKTFNCQGERCLEFAIGRQDGVRVIQGYDKGAVQITAQVQADSHIKLAHVISVPDLGLLAVEDRTTDRHIPAQQALNALRTIVEKFGQGQGSFHAINLSDADVRVALETWDLEQYDYTVAPLNPISAGRLAERRSEAMKQENIGRERGTVLPRTESGMNMNEGIIAETAALTEVGYGQNGFKGRTEEGHVAHIPKPRFHDTRQKNLAEREKPRFLRMFFDAEDENHRETVASALMKFYKDE